MNRSSRCSHGRHDKCNGLIEQDDGSAYVCECNCRHPGLRPTQEPELPPASVPSPDCPPPHPQGFDHYRFRASADDQPGIDPYQPWVRDFCIECKLPTWTHDAVRAAKHEILCEDCSYMLLSALAETRAKRQNLSVPRYHDPFTRQT